MSEAFGGRMRRDGPIGRPKGTAGQGILRVISDSQSVATTRVTQHRRVDELSWACRRLAVRPRRLEEGACALAAGERLLPKCGCCEAAASQRGDGGGESTSRRQHLRCAGGACRNPHELDTALAAGEGTRAGAADASVAWGPAWPLRCVSRGPTSLRARLCRLTRETLQDTTDSTKDEASRARGASVGRRARRGRMRRSGLRPRRGGVRGRDASRWLCM